MSQANLLVFNFSAQAQADADGVHTVKLPCDVTIVGVSLCAEAFSGSPTGFDIDIQDDGTDIITAIEADTAGTAGEWLSTHFGGSETPVHVAAGSELEVDVNFTAGSTPTGDYDIAIFALQGA